MRFGQLSYLGLGKYALKNGDVIAEVGLHVRIDLFRGAGIHAHKATALQILSNIRRLRRVADPPEILRVDEGVTAQLIEVYRFACNLATSGCPDSYLRG